MFPVKDPANNVLTGSYKRLALKSTLSPNFQEKRTETLHAVCKRKIVL